MKWFACDSECHPQFHMIAGSFQLMALIGTSNSIAKQCHVKCALLRDPLLSLGEGPLGSNSFLEEGKGLCHFKSPYPPISSPPSLFLAPAYLTSPTVPSGLAQHLFCPLYCVALLAKVFFHVWPFFAYWLGHPFALIQPVLLSSAGQVLLWKEALAGAWNNSLVQQKKDLARSGTQGSTHPPIYSIHLPALGHFHGTSLTNDQDSDSYGGLTTKISWKGQRWQQGCL